jgi:hypothetical protein
VRKFYAARNVAGTWIFDQEHSQLSSPPPLHWVQHVSTDRGRIRVLEEITRSTGLTKVEVDAAPDGEFYPVSGSLIVDEISYSIEGTNINGIGRKGGIVSLRETLTSPAPDNMTVSLSVLMNGKEIPLGVAYFRRQMTPS